MVAHNGLCLLKEKIRALLLESIQVVSAHYIQDFYIKNCLICFKKNKEFWFNSGPTVLVENW